MVILKKRAVAFIVAALVMLGAMAYSVHKHLGAACNEVADTFYSGVFNPEWGTTRPSLDGALTRRYQAANGLLTLVVSHNEAGSATDAEKNLRTARDDLRAAMSVPDKFRAKAELEDRFGEAIAILSRDSLTAREREMLDNYGAEFDAAREVVDQSGYNEAVRAFYHNTLDVFPANLLRIIVSDKLPKLFE